MISTTPTEVPGVLLWEYFLWVLPVAVFEQSGSGPTSTIPLLREYSHKSGIVLVGVLPNFLKCYTGIKIEKIYKFDILLPDKSPGVIPLDIRTWLDEIYNSQKALNDIKVVLPECLLLFVGVLPESLSYLIFFGIPEQVAYLTWYFL